MLDFTEHQISTISMWAEIAILAFMVWEKYGPSWGTIPMSPRATTGVGSFLIENRTLVVAVLGLGFVAWLNLGRPTAPNAGSFWLWLALIVVVTAGALVLLRNTPRAQNILISPTLQTGLYVSDIRFGFASLSERHGEWSMRVFNGTGRTVEFSSLSGRIKFNAPNSTDVSQRGELPEPSVRADMAQTVGPFKEWLVILSQRVPAAEADKLLAMLAGGTPIHFNLSGLTIRVCTPDDRQKIERLPIWGGVSYSHGHGFGQIIHVTAHMGVKLT